MKIFGYELRRISNAELQNVVSGYGGHFYAPLFSNTMPMLLSAVYRCVEVISDAVAQLPLEIYSVDTKGFKSLERTHPVFTLLHDEPNEQMTRFTFMKVMATAMLLRGNAYAYINRDNNGVATDICFLPNDSVDIIWVSVDGVKRKRYQVGGFSQLVEPKDMIHILNFSYDGIKGISTLAHARNTIDIANYNEQCAGSFFKSGASVNGVLSIQDARLNQKQKQQIYDEWSARTTSTGQSSNIVVLEGNQSFTPISISPKDSQMLESRQYSVIDICRFFGVSPVKAFDLSKSSYSTVEATQLAFLTDTLAPIIEKIEQEINRKIFTVVESGRYVAKFKIDSILRADKASQSEFYAKLFNMGAITPNEIRRENDLDWREDGDEAFVQVNVQKLANAVSAEPVTNNPEPQTEPEPTPTRKKKKM